MSDPQSLDPRDTSNSGNLGLRLIWMVGFPAVVVYAMKISKQPEWSFNVHDLVFWCVVAIAITARVQDARRYRGLTAIGAPTTRRHLIGYSVALVLTAAVLWSFGNSVDL